MNTSPALPLPTSQGRRGVGAQGRRTVSRTARTEGSAGGSAACRFARSRLSLSRASLSRAYLCRSARHRQHVLMLSRRPRSRGSARLARAAEMSTFRVFDTMILPNVGYDCGTIVPL